MKSSVRDQAEGTYYEVNGKVRGGLGLGMR